MRVPLYGRQGMIVCDHHLAALEGFQTLREGGSFVDAAIAAAAVQTVVLPQACTLGGDVLALVHEAASRRTRCLNATGRSPASLQPEYYAGGIPKTGPFTVSVPGVVGGWQALHDAYGNLPWPHLLAPAGRLARDGFAASGGLAEASWNAAEQLARDCGSAQCFLPDRKPLQTGQTFRQPALAEVLEQLGAHGARQGFYCGPPARAIAGTLSGLGAHLNEQDFAAFEPEWCEPLSIDFRGRTIKAAPPNSFGLYMLVQLGLRERLLGDCVGRDQGELTSRGIEISRLAFSAADEVVADAPDADSRAREMLTSSSLDKLGRRIDDKAPSAARDAGGTSIVLVADEAGNGVCIVQSIFMPFGSAVTDPETGILLNNRMIGFYPPGDHPNAIAPAKRPAHTLNPCVLTDDAGQLNGLLGTPGGPGQTLTLAQVLSGLLAENQTLYEVVNRPRWSTDLTGACLFEPGFPEDVLRHVSNRNIHPTVTSGTEPFYGSAQVVLRNQDGLLSGAADGRREAHVLGR